MKHLIAVLIAITITTSVEAQCRRIENTRAPDENGEASIGVTCIAGEHLSGIYCNIISGYGYTEQQLTGTGSGRCLFALSDISEPFWDENDNLIEAAPIYEGTPRAQALCCK